MTGGSGLCMQGQVAVVTGAAAGIGLASAQALMALGACVVMVDRDAQALAKVCAAHGACAVPLVLDLLDAEQCQALMPQVLDRVDRVDILHANAGLYLGGDLVDADPQGIDRLVQLNVAVVMKNVRDALRHMLPRHTGDVVVTSSLAAHYPTPWEPVYAASKWAIDCFVQTTRRQVFQHGIRVGAVSPGPVMTSLLADWPPEKLQQARQQGSVIEAAEVAQAIVFMLTRPRSVTVRDLILMPTQFDL